MTFRSARLTLPFAAFLSVGCGTVHNLNPGGETLIKGPGQEDPPKTTRVFGGVRNDWMGLTTLNWNDEYSFLNFVVLPFYVTDLPLSLVGDTVTLPYTAVYALFSQRITPPNATETGKQPGEDNAFAPFAGNTFNSWFISPRVDLPLNR